MKFIEGAFKEWAYEVAAEEFGAELLDGGPWMKFKNPKTGREVIVKDAIADAMLQQILLRPAEYDVIATLNLNGDYLSDRSEEHTSELQSLMRISYAVFCLKKKNKKIPYNTKKPVNS